MTADELQAYLHREIPLSEAMDVTVVDPGPDTVVLTAPLAPNTNHRDTAFGGSVSTLATLAGWALVHRRLAESGRRSQVVIQWGSTEYLHPVSSDFTATCDGMDDTEWRRLTRTLDRRGMGRARVEVEVEVTAGGRVVARFQGAFVALAREEKRG